VEFFGGSDDGAGAGDGAESGEKGGVHCRCEKDSTAVAQEKETDSSMKSRTLTGPSCDAQILEQLELPLGFHTELG
jgi:hypothetical protein